MPCPLQVVAANEKVEEANAKRQQESERSMQALQQKSAATYNKQVMQFRFSLTCAIYGNYAVYLHQVLALCLITSHLPTDHSQCCTSYYHIVVS